jgi:hypothetical protein
MAVPPLTSVPKGTIVQISVRLPLSAGAASDGFQWVAWQSMTVAEARRHIEAELLSRFLQQFLPAGE